MKKIAAVCLSLVLLFALAACGTQKNTAPESESGAISGPANLAGGVQIGNPYVTCKDAAEMFEQAGFELTLPEELPEWVHETIYRAMPGKLAEVIYQNEENEIRVRAAEGSEDISGVYDSDCSYEEDLTIGENTVHVKGEKTDEGTVLYVCTWTSGGRTYSVTSANGASAQEMQSVIEAVH